MIPVTHIDRGLWRPALLPGPRHFYRLITDPHYRFLQTLHHRLARLPRRTPGSIEFRGRTIAFADAESLFSTWREIMVNRIYDIGEVSTPPTLIDCGGNIGLAEIYWSIRYPGFKSTVFEPDPTLVAILRQNLETWAQDARLIESALGSSERTARFNSEGSDAGALEDAESAPQTGKSIEVKVERLAKYLNEKVDLLKIDIEGAEWEVLADIRHSLDHVERVFLEIHCFADRWRDYGTLISLMHEAGFSAYCDSDFVNWKTPPFHTTGQGQAQHLMSLFFVRRH